MNQQEVLRAIDLLESEGCSCDLLYGYECGIHQTAQQVRKELGLA